MPLIFVDTDNSDPKDKLYDASKAGSSAEAAERVMQATVKKVIDKSADFTTAKTKNAKGYVIRLEVVKVEVANHKTKCGISGSIVRYPRKVVKSGDEGEEMVSTSMTGNATSTGTSARSLLDCVEAIAEDLAQKAIPIMRDDFLNKR
jgi:hypothetical protein